MFPLIALSVYDRFSDRRIAIDHATEEALNAVRLAVAGHARLFAGARQLLTGLAQAPSVQSLDAARATALFREMVKRFPFYGNIGAATPAGDLFAAAVMDPGRVSIADRDYFQRALQTRDFVHSGYVIGRVTGKPTIVLAYPSVDERGAVRAVVLAAMDLTWMAQHPDTFHLPTGSVVTAIDGNGVVLARHPEGSGVGQAMPDAEIVKTILDRRAEGTARLKEIDGVRRLYAFAPLPFEKRAGEAYIVVGIPEAVAFGGASRRLAWALAVFAATLGLAFAGAWLVSDRFVLRHVSALREAAARLGGGDLTARTGLGEEKGELGDLARAFDGMAGTLEQRTRGLAEAEGRYRALVEQSLAGVYVTDAESFLYMNQAAADILGYTVEALVSRLAPMHVVHPDDRELVARNIRARLDGAVEALRYSFRCVRKDGTTIECEVFGRRVTYEGRPAILGTVIDVTERKRAEVEMRRLNRALQAISQCNQALIRARDEPELLGEVCRMILDVGGYRLAGAGLAEHDEGRTIRVVAHAGDEAGYLQTARLSWGDGEAGRGPAGVAIRTGRPCIIRNALTDPAFAPWRDEAARRGYASVIALPLISEGQALGVLGIYAGEPDAFEEPEVELLTQLADDVAYGMAALRARAEQQRAQEEMERQREAIHHREKLAEMGSLLAGVAHELNNPLTVLIGRINLLRATMEGGPGAEGLDKAAAAADRCVRIVRNFLALARQRPPERQQTSLNQVVREAVELLAYSLRVNNVEVSFVLAEDLPALWADSHQLHQVVVNLITNASQSMQESAGPRRLTFTTRSDAEGRRVILEVADTGPGIPPEVRKRLFEPFFTTKPVGQGTGLGLAMCQGIVEGHGGAIRVESAPGQGATFVVELPVELPPVQDSEASPTPAQPRRRGGRILVVDDEPAVARLLEEILAADGHRVDTAVNGADALVKLGERAYDAVLSDIRMPDLDGPGLYRELERRHPEITTRIVFMTGDALGQRTREFLDASGVPSFEKPFRPEDVKRVISRILSPRIPEAS